MHKYASPTPEARELVSELEFVWDQIKSNPSSSSSSSPLQNVSSLQPQLHPQPSYTSIGGSRNDIPSSALTTGSNPNRLRVLSPVSQRDEDDLRLEEEIPEDNYSDPLRSRSPLNSRNLKWRRRVEQALTKLTAEVAALNEQLESNRRLYGPGARRKPGLWPWIKWIVWVAIRQVVWDAIILAAVALWMRWKGDKRLEKRLGLAWERIRGWVEGLARRIGRSKLLRNR
jgi:hypothetical protein